MSESVRITPLGYALLGLLRMRPDSGYGIRKTFASSPMGRYSGSPGAIYPALARLAQQGLIRSESRAAGSRRKDVYRVTPQGWHQLERWLRQRVTRSELVWQVDLMWLRFSYLGLLGDPGMTCRFLEDYRAAARKYAGELRRFLEGQGARMPTHGRLALERGLDCLRADLRWAARTVKRQSASSSHD